MNFLAALIKYASIGFLVGFLASTGPDLGNDFLPLAGMMVFIVFILVVFELTNFEAASTLPAKGVEVASLRAVLKEGKSS